MKTHQRKIDFGSLEWETPLPGARYKAARQGARQIRVVEFTKGFVEPDWCTKGHIGYVLSGEVDIDFDGEIIRFREGDGLMIFAGKEDRHKANVITDVVTLVLIEESEHSPPAKIDRKTEAQRAELSLEPKQGLVGAVVLTALHAVLWVGLFILMLGFVPRFVHMFEELGAELPVLSQQVIQVSALVAAYWYLFVVLGIVGMALDFVVLLVLGRAGRIVQSLVGVLFALVPPVLGFLVLVGIWLPLIQMVEALS